MNSICPGMKGMKCAESYCDMWDLDEKRCSNAVVNERKTRLLDLLIEEAEKQQDKRSLRTEVAKRDLDTVLH